MPKFTFLPTGVPVLKRVFDLVSSLLLMVVISPVFLLILLLVWSKLGRPIFFVQERPGYKGKLFKLRKFRTMKVTLPGEDGSIDSDAQRLTPFGSFLRSTSLDELPELIHIFCGEMSAVGPRPLLVSYLPLYSREQMRRHDVLPGMTGWAQINGRNTLSWEDKFALDIWYVDHWSFWLDLKIIFLSIWKVFRREGISEDGQVTAREWTGNK